MIVSWVHGGSFVTDLAPISFQFLRYNHGNACIRPLPQFGMIHDHRHSLISGDADECVKRDWGVGLAGGKGRIAQTRKMNAQNQSTTREHARLEKIPATAIHDGVHLAPPCDLSWAAR